MNNTERNSIIWVCVLIAEAIILKLSKSSRLWIYIAFPIILGFAAAELLAPKPKQKTRNLK